MTHAQIESNKPVAPANRLSAEPDAAPRGGEPFDLWPNPAVISRNGFRHKALSDWSFNIAMGCAHGCEFCYVPDVSANWHKAELQKFGVHDPDGQWGDYSLLRQWDEAEFIKSLERAENTPPEQLSEDGNRAIIYCSTTDPYQVLGGPTPQKAKILNDARHDIVRRSLELILERSTLNVRILTRGTLAIGDFDLYEKFGDRLVFGMSLPTLNADLAKLYEPKAPSPAARLRVLREAKGKGLNVFVAMAPTPPESNEADLRRTMEAIAGLDPVTIFHEPINVRAENVARIQARAEELGVPFRAGTFASTGAWAKYAIGQLLDVQRIAGELGLMERLKLWPDECLASPSTYVEFREHAFWGGNPPGFVARTARRARAETFLNDFNGAFLPWVSYWHGVKSAWPGR